jgi:hypothetical protein
MRVIRTCAALIVLSVLATATVGQESPQPAPEPAAPLPDKPAPAASSDPQPAAPPRGGASDEAFIPTQELQADEEATFPVDI